MLIDTTNCILLLSLDFPSHVNFSCETRLRARCHDYEARTIATEITLHVGHQDHHTCVVFFKRVGIIILTQVTFSAESSQLSQL